MNQKEKGRVFVFDDDADASRASSPRCAATGSTFPLRRPAGGLRASRPRARPSSPTAMPGLTGPKCPPRHEESPESVVLLRPTAPSRGRSRGGAAPPISPQARGIPRLRAAVFKALKSAGCAGDRTAP